MRLMLGLDHGGGETLFDGERFTSIRRPMHHVGTLLEATGFHPTRTARNHLKMLGFPLECGHLVSTLQGEPPTEH
ncbi:hypothetical protein [Haloactinospora alba]|uniref:hypothetical protein n=1 Tax=Haloactinospora alba TaxID=405555 RepID=UPI0011525512|nr:hypothetical protein [Haloactinospora alba]